MTQTKFNFFHINLFTTPPISSSIYCVMGANFYNRAQLGTHVSEVDYNIFSFVSNVVINHLLPATLFNYNKQIIIFSNYMPEN